MKKPSPEGLLDKFSQNIQIPRLHTEHAKKGFIHPDLKILRGLPVHLREVSAFDCSI